MRCRRTYVLKNPDSNFIIILRSVGGCEGKTTDLHEVFHCVDPGMNLFKVCLHAPQPGGHMLQASCHHFKPVYKQYNFLFTL